MVIGINKFLRVALGVVLLCGLPASAKAVFTWQMPPTTFPNEGPYVMTQADNNAHAILLKSGGFNGLNAFYLSNGIWTLSNTLVVSDVVDTFDVSMEPSGTALAIWRNVSAGTVNTKYFNGSTWSTPSPDPLDTFAGSSFPVAVSMNIPGQGLAVWSDPTQVKASFFTGGSTWSTPDIINTATSPSTFSNYSANGTAVASWIDNTTFDVFAVNFDGSSWNSTPQLVVPFTANLGNIGIDANGIAFYIYQTSGNIIVTRFNANNGSLFAPQTISTGVGNFFPLIAVAPNGSAVAVWIDSVNKGITRTFNGSVWSSPFTFSLDVSQLAISVDPQGNALVVWSDSAGSVFAKRLALGSGAWSSLELVNDSLPIPPQDLSSSLSASGIGIAAWDLFIGEQPVTEASISSAFAVTPPTAIRGEIIKLEAPTKTDRVNQIVWCSSEDPAVVAYIIRRNGVVIAEVPSTRLSYCDPNRCRNQVYVYTVTAVDAQGNESTPVTVTL